MAKAGSGASPQGEDRRRVLTDGQRALQGEPSPLLTATTWLTRQARPLGPEGHPV